MDVGNPSNYVRLLSLYGNEIGSMRATISGDRITDEETIATISKTFRETGYVLDPHTAVGVLALERSRCQTRSTNPGVVLATAHPAKFANTVTNAIGHDPEAPPQLAQALKKEGDKVPLRNSYAELQRQLATIG
jgi:threonine synthase